MFFAALFKAQVYLSVSFLFSYMQKKISLRYKKYRKGSVLMYYLKAEASFDSAHFLYGYEGKCSNIHGHRWKIEVTVQNAFLQRNGQQKGMIMDFSDLKRAVRLIAEHYDHSLIYEKNTLKSDTLECLKRDGFRLIEMPFRPTAENLARQFFTALKERGYRVSRVAVYETPENCAMYDEG